MKKSLVAFTRSATCLEALGVAVGQLPRGDALALGRLGDRLAVLVGAREEEDVLAALAHVAGEHVGGHRGVDVAEVGLAVDVVDRRGDVVGHGGRCYWRARSAGGGRRAPPGGRELIRYAADRGSRATAPRCARRPSRSPEAAEARRGQEQARRRPRAQPKSGPPARRAGRRTRGRRMAPWASAGAGPRTGGGHAARLRAPPRGRAPRARAAHGRGRPRGGTSSGAPARRGAGAAGRPARAAAAPAGTRTALRETGRRPAGPRPVAAPPAPGTGTGSGTPPGARARAGAPGGGRKRQRVAIGVAAARLAHAEVQVRRRRPSGAARAHGAERAPARDAGRPRRPRPPRGAGRTCRSAVGRADGHGEAGRAGDPAKRTVPAAAAATGVPTGRRDVDTAVLTARVGVVAVAVAA